MNGGDSNQQPQPQQQQQQQQMQHQQWVAMQQYQQQWMAMQYPAMAMQQQMMYNQHYVPYYHPHHLPQQQQYQQQPPPQPSKQNNQIQSTGEDNKTIWIGDLQQWMDEGYLQSCFSQTGEVVSVKIIRNKQTGQSERYGFIEFNSHLSAEKVLQSYNGTVMPNTEQPFRLNWAAFSSGDRRPEAGSDLSIFVGDLATDVTDAMLHDTFASRFPSVKGAKVVVDANSGRSKGYGFVRFGDENERSRAMTEMNGVFCSSRPMRIGVATPKKPSPQQQYSSQAVVLAGGYPNGIVPQGQSENDSSNTTIFVGGLDSDVTDEELRQSFSPFGDVVSVKIPAGKGCGFVQFANRSNAEDAIQRLNGTVIGKQTVRLSWGRNMGNKQSRVDPNSQWNGAYYGRQGYNGYGYGAGAAAYGASSNGHGNHQQPVAIYSAVKMKGVFVLLLCVSCLLAFTQGFYHGGSGFEPLGKLIRARLSKRSVNSVTDEDAPTEHLPVYLAPQVGLKEADKISQLPGQPDVNFVQYSGYVTVDPAAGRALFYYFTESENSSTKPLVLWLNGGPGCSSLAGGAMMELGPFRVNPDGKTLWHNEYAWNKLANVLFLESPAGVGFSYSNTSVEYGDKWTAADSYTFLLNWFERFPEYKTRDFYITGESYAGHYVPQLALLILKNNKITNHTVINLKGIAIGNAEIDFEDELSGMYDYYWTHALISNEHHKAILSNCNFSSSASVSAVCNSVLDQADAAIGTVYYYDIYAPLCNSSSNSPLVSGFDPCSSNYVFTYLNTPDVQKALHANVTGITGPWDACNYTVFLNWNDRPDTILPTIKELMADGIRVWIYSGDTDKRVPVTSTRYSLEKLGTPVKTPWYPWYNQGEVGGYAVEYQNVTFVSIRGAGHFVPSYQPQRALVVFSSFLDGKLPPGRN
ncbi:Polyadenylate-binding protein RBP47 [Sesamum alatum]|uniref:Carboxypeptidase n=1 Tax=Sesamum alatum TaxID=300844 RepID=A0AAE2CX93_9LAMI|nr:Polyadenylate-binding protein RBP47 [Sesamum alatum]